MMTSMKWLIPILRVACVSLLALVLLTFVSVQVQQRLLRYRAEHLMMDTHKIRLYQSTWEDAQRLMNRWASWVTTRGIALRQIAVTESRWLI
jgi:hypothetical protein